MSKLHRMLSDQLFNNIQPLVLTRQRADGYLRLTIINISQKIRLKLNNKS